MSHGMGQFKTVHRPRHVNVGKYHPDIVAALKYLYCFIGVGSLKDLKACILSHFDRAPSNQRFVFNDEDD
jgi:hypothetical protein